MSEENLKNTFESIFSGEPEVPAPDAQMLEALDSEDSIKVEKVGKHVKASVPLGTLDPYNHAAEQEVIDAKKRESGTLPPSLPETQDMGIRNPKMMATPVDYVKEEMERRFTHEFGQQKVNVTATDRDAFARAALLDQEVVFDILLEGLDITIRIAMAPDEFTSSAAAAVTQWQQDGLMSKDSDMQWLLAFQQVHAWYQVRSINSVPTPWSDFWVDGLPALKDIRLAMREHERFDPFFRMNAARWRMLMEAVRIAELKYKLCLQSWNDRSFFTGADTD